MIQPGRWRNLPGERSSRNPLNKNFVVARIAYRVPPSDASLRISKEGLRQRLSCLSSDSFLFSNVNRFSCSSTIELVPGERTEPNRVVYPTDPHLYYNVLPFVSSADAQAKGTAAAGIDAEDWRPGGHRVRNSRADFQCQRFDGYFEGG